MQIEPQSNLFSRSTHQNPKIQAMSQANMKSEAKTLRSPDPISRYKRQNLSLIQIPHKSTKYHPDPLKHNIQAPKIAKKGANQKGNLTNDSTRSFGDGDLGVRRSNGLSFHVQRCCSSSAGCWWWRPVLVKLGAAAASVLVALLFTTRCSLPKLLYLF